MKCDVYAPELELPLTVTKVSFSNSGTKYSLPPLSDLLVSLPTDHISFQACGSSHGGVTSVPEKSNTIVRPLRLRFGFITRLKLLQMSHFN